MSDEAKRRPAAESLAVAETAVTPAPNASAGGLPRALVESADTALGLSPPPGSPPAPAAVGPHRRRSERPPTPGDTDPLLGRVLGGLYRVESKIGEGGMGTVYLATHIHLHKKFALKVLAPRIASDAMAVRRFLQEAKAASAIDHENIVDVVNFDTTDDGEVFIVMELLKGKSLADVLDEEGALPVQRAVYIGVQICRALQAAHERGIIHRDLKPENVFLVRRSGNEIVKVLDFGISKMHSAEAESVRVTKTGQLVGTPLYMSPEQARGETTIDHRADIYSLAVILYDMLTGAPPFRGANYFQLLWQHGNETPEPLRERRPGAGIPDALEAVVLRGLAKDPAARHGSMQEVEAALVASMPELPAVPTLLSHPATPTSLRPTPSGSTPSGVRVFDSMAGAPAPPADHRAPSFATRQVGLPRALAVALGLAALVAGGMYVWSTGRGEPSEDRSTLPAPTRATTPTLPPTPGRGPSAPAVAAPTTVPTSAAPAAPSEVTVHFGSRPAGAAVSIGDRTLGVTPLAAPVSASEAPVAVRFTLQGRVAQTVEVVPSEGLRVDVELPRERSRPEGSGKSPAGLPIKHTL